MKNWILQAKKKLSQVKSVDNPSLEADLILAKSLDISKLEIVTKCRELEVFEIELANKLLVRRLTEEPLAYILEKKEFYSLDFIVSEDTLIPRADSECIIDYALGNMPQNKISLLDLGTGTGILALTLLYYRKNWAATLVDISYGALEVAKKNAINLNVSDRCEFVLADYCKVMDYKHSFDLIVSNPAYIGQSDYNSLDTTVRDFEPKIALTSGATGFEQIEKVIELAASNLKNNGLLLMEHGIYQESYCLELLEKNGNFKNLASLKDLAGINRAIKVNKI